MQDKDFDSLFREFDEKESEEIYNLDLLGIEDIWDFELGDK